MPDMLENMKDIRQYERRNLVAVETAKQYWSNC